MSCTEIYGFNKNGKAYEIAEIGNSHRGAMAVWTLLEKKYLPPTQFMRIISSDGAQELWDLYKDKRLTEAERIVLMSTFDKVIINKENIVKLLDAFRQFEGYTSLKEQADAIEQEIKANKNIIAIAFNQTSVNADTWDNYNYNEKKEESYPYNIKKQNDHWELFEELARLSL